MDSTYMAAIEMKMMVMMAENVGGGQDGGKREGK